MKSAANAENIRTKGHKNISASRHTGMDLRPYILRVSGSLRRQPLCFMPWSFTRKQYITIALSLHFSGSASLRHFQLQT